MQDDERNDLTGPFDGLVTTPPVPPPSPLDGAPTMAKLYGWPDLIADRDRKLVSLATLPHRSGLGEPLNALLGGGLPPGYMMLVGASSAGAGKTAFLMQAADGLAARTAELVASGGQGPLTPVVIVSEMPASALSWRSIARWTGKDSRIFRAGQSAVGLERADGSRVSQADVDEAYREAQAALEGDLGQARLYQRYLSEPDTGEELVGQIGEIVDAWRAEFPGRDVWPVIVIDPVQRHAGGDNEIEGLNELAKAIRVLKNDHKCIVLLASDTNALAARGQAKGGDRQQTAVSAIRGSYSLVHEADAVLVLGPAPEVEDSQKRIEVEIVKNRWGPHLPDPTATALYFWSPTRAELIPLSAKAMQEVHAKREEKAKVANDSNSQNVDDLQAKARAKMEKLL